MNTYQKRVLSLNSYQREAIGLLSIGTFLEYFDLMLYIHMAVLLNQLFFPKTDHQTAALISAFSFCSTYVLRPLGGIIFGYIGDQFGRKITIVITTFIMAISCLTIANLPTYNQIGIAAAWIITVCRVMQGMACMGEAAGAELYLTETIKPPLVYPVVALIVIFASIGTTVSLGVASLVTSYNFDWRFAFWAGAIVALIGTVARTTLRETPDFADAKRRISNIIKQSNENVDLEPKIFHKEEVKIKTFLALFFIQCLWPVCLYFAYIYCGDLLKNSFHFTPEQVIHQNFIVSCFQLISYLFLVYFSYKFYPLNILKIKLVIFSILALISPYLLNIINSSFELLLLQSLIVIFVPTDFPSAPIFYTHFPVFKRFTCVCLTYGLARAFMAIIASFGLSSLVINFGYYGILIIMIPIIFGYTFGLFHFEKLEKISGNHPK